MRLDAPVRPFLLLARSRLAAASSSVASCAGAGAGQRDLAPTLAVWASTSAAAAAASRQRMPYSTAQAHDSTGEGVWPGQQPGDSGAGQGHTRSASQAAQAKPPGSRLAKEDTSPDHSLELPGGQRIPYTPQLGFVGGPDNPAPAIPVYQTINYHGEDVDGAAVPYPLDKVIVQQCLVHNL